MTIIEATSAGIRDLVDGTLRITFDIEPRHAQGAYALFGIRGTACAIAVLTQAASIQVAQQETIALVIAPGQLCIMACSFCNAPKFQEWIGASDRAHAKELLLQICGCASRKDLDVDSQAANIFHAHVRIPYLAWLAGQRT